MLDEAQHHPRGKNGRAPDVFERGGWVPMREYPNDEEVDFAIVGTGAGGGTLACRLAEQGFKVVAFDAGAWWRPLEEFASDESHQAKLYWTDERICDGENPLKLGNNNSGKAVGGSTVHFAMVSLRFRPEWFRSRSVLGYGADWPLDWREMWRYYAQVEDALKISGPVNYPWGPKRPRYPYRAHELNAAALVLARGAEALGIDWTATPLATLSAPRGKAHPCVYRGFCTSGCATNAKQSALVTWIPRAVSAGAEIRDLAMVGRIVTNDAGLATGVDYLREGRWQFQRAKNVVVAGYAIETPRLLLMSANGRFPDGLAEQFGARRQESHGAVESGCLRHVRRRNPLVQGAAVARDHRTLELQGYRQGLLRRLRLHEPGTVARRLGRRAERPRLVGRRVDRRDAQIQPSGRIEDRRRNLAAGTQPCDAR